MESQESLRAFYKRITPIVPELFNMAYAICGTHEGAEYALQYTLLEAWMGEMHGGVGFHEGMRNAIRAAALEQAGRSRGESAPWNGLTELSDDPFLALLAQTDAEKRRAVALCCGCGLTRRRAAKLMGLSRRRVDEIMNGFERRLRVQSRYTMDARTVRRSMLRSVRGAMAEETTAMPPHSQIYRAFAEEASDTEHPKRLAGRIAKQLAIILLGLVCVALFWLTAVLLHPTETTPAADMEIAETDK